jgi:Ice-binding-like/PEP-CTERM motif
MRFGSLKQLILVLSAVPAFGGPITVNLGSASTFGLLGGTISNTGTSVVHGDVGATITITGFPPGTATGTVYTAPNAPPTPVGMAYTDFETAFTIAAGDLSTATPAGLAASETFLGGGVYAFPNLALTTSTAAITLTFDAENLSNQVFIMQFPGALTIDGPITFNLIGGALASNIYWIVGSPANPKAMTIDPTNVPVTWDGDILAGTFTMSANAGPGGSGVLAGTVNGCVLTVNANTLAGQTIVGGCSSSVPEPGSAGLLGLGFLAVAVGWKLRSVR